jgi:hypothetical protein
VSLRHRLQPLEEARQEKAAIWLLCVDEQGLVLDDGSAAIRPFVGKHYSAVPGNPKLVVVIDPMVVLWGQKMGRE